MKKLLFLMFIMCVQIGMSYATEADTKEKVKTFNGKILVLKNFSLADLSDLGSFGGVNLASKADNAKVKLQWKKGKLKYITILIDYEVGNNSNARAKALEIDADILRDLEKLVGINSSEILRGISSAGWASSTDTKDRCSSSSDTKSSASSWFGTLSGRSKSKTDQVCYTDSKDITTSVYDTTNYSGKLMIPTKGYITHNITIKQ